MGGVQIASCGEDAIRTLHAHANVVVRYSKKSTEILVNDEGWRAIALGDAMFARKRDTSGFLLTLRFSRHEQRAKGMLLYMQVDSMHQPTCADAIMFVGTYTR